MGMPLQDGLSYKRQQQPGGHAQSFEAYCQKFLYLIENFNHIFTLENDSNRARK